MRSTLFSCTLATAVLMPVVVLAAPTTTPRYNTPRRPDLNAFVNHAVMDTKTLVSEVRRDPEVADRYMRLYGMSKEQVMGFLGTLHRETLQNTAEFTVWSAPPGVNFKQHQEVLKKGTPIFADSEGHPTLLVKCGNPLRIPGRFPLALSLVPPTSTPTIETDLPGPRDVDSEAANPFTSEMPIIPEVIPPISVGPQDIVAMTVVSPVPNPAKALPYLGLAPLLAPIFGSSSNSSIVIFPAPEPAPLVALGLGAVAMVRRRRRKA